MAPDICNTVELHLIYSPSLQGPQVVMTDLAVNLTTSGIKAQKRLGTPVMDFCLIKLFEMGKSTSNPTL